MPSRNSAKAENELANVLWRKGYLVVRAAASGRGVRERFQPDLVAAKNGVILIIEVKSTNSETIYLRAEQVNGLRELRDRSRGHVFIAVRLRGGEWRFHSLDDLKEVSEKSYRLDNVEEGLRLRDVEELLFKRSKKIPEFF
ncbi:MAG: Holliday junction resolvase Hjc [Acidilobaceae archaeon]|nr:Holliday junction resolvase Hjc [Acidilobaceae archaeon]MCX8165099.1 Holliday junction resolvase Hjc [Acidilobaceae archaeon]MDW7974384.1 Holliday junction resolvase Hjc [Sulfolobales archaeon]